MVKLMLWCRRMKVYKYIKDFLVSFHAEEINCLKNNKEEIQKRRTHVFFVLATLTLIVCACLMLTIFFRDDITLALIGFYSVSIAVFLLFLLSAKIITKANKPISNWFIMLFFFLLIVYAEFDLQACHGDQAPSIAFVPILFIIQTLMLDRSLRINVFTILLVCLHIVFCYFTKIPSIFLDDLSYDICFLVISMVVGIVIRRNIFLSIENTRLLIIQKNTDMLTELQNRRKLFETFKEFSEHKGKRTINAIIMVDIDFFKKYNDTYGHQMGDSCLQRLGACFAEFSRDTGMQMFRYGGEEFTGIGFNLTESELATYAEKLRKDVEDLCIPYPSYQNGVVTISVGYVYKKTHIRQSYDLLLQMADDALYAAKDKGRNCVSASAPLV